MGTGTQQSCPAVARRGPCAHALTQLVEGPFSSGVSDSVRLRLSVVKRGLCGVSSPRISSACLLCSRSAKRSQLILSHGPWPSDWTRRDSHRSSKLGGILVGARRNSRRSRHPYPSRRPYAMERGRFWRPGVLVLDTVRESVVIERLPRRLTTPLAFVIPPTAAVGQLDSRWSVRLSCHQWRRGGFRKCSRIKERLWLVDSGPRPSRCPCHRLCEPARGAEGPCAAAPVSPTCAICASFESPPGAMRMESADTSHLVRGNLPGS